MRYKQSQYIVLKKYKEHNPNLSLLIQEIILNRSKCIPLQVDILVGDKISTQIVADSFVQSCYTLMTTDINRTNTYKLWIESTNGETHYKDKDQSDIWLEIGPGSDACLAKIALDTYPGIEYIGIETNKFAYASAKKKLQNYSNVKLMKAYVDQNFTRSNIQSKSVDYILHEIFGTIASSEGVGMVLNRIKELYPNSISIPSCAQTFIVPLELTYMDVINDPTLIITPNVIRCKIPFDQTEIANHAILEELEFDNIELEQTHKTKCVITRNGFISALGIYIMIGFNNIMTSSNQDKDNASTNWSNIGLILPNVVQVRRNQIVHIKSSIDITTVTPSYHVELIMGKDTYVFDINQNDLYGTYQELHTIHK